MSFWLFPERAHSYQLIDATPQLEGLLTYFAETRLLLRYSHLVTWADYRLRERCGGIAG